MIVQYFLLFLNWISVGAVLIFIGAAGFVIGLVVGCCLSWGTLRVSEEKRALRVAWQQLHEMRVERDMWRARWKGETGPEMQAFLEKRKIA